MTDPLATGAANAPDGSPAPQADPPADGANSDAALANAQPEGEVPAASPDATAATSTAGDGGKPPQGRADQRIAELVAQRDAASQSAEYWRNLATTAPPAKQADPPAPPAAPTLDQFESVDAWSQAHAKWTQEEIARQAAVVVEQTLKNTREAEAAQVIQSEWNSRVAAFKATHPHFDAVVGNPSLPITPSMREVITTSPVGPALAMHLGENPAEAARISRLSPSQQGAALSRIEATLTAAPAPKPTPPAGGNKPPVRPAPPMTPVGGGAAPSKSFEEMGIDEYMANRTWAHRK